MSRINSIILLLSLLITLPSHGESRIVATYRGPKNPTEHGWRLVKSESTQDSTGARGLEESGGAWRVHKTRADHNSLFCYHAEPASYDAQAVADAESKGWILTAKLRIIASSGEHGQGIELGTSTTRYAISFGRTDQGDPIVYFYSGLSSPVVLHGSGDGFHTYELSCAPRSTHAFLKVDGKPVGGPFEGIAAGEHGGRLIFGNNSSGAWGTVDYAWVRLEVAPEREQWPKWRRPDVPVSAKLLWVKKIWDKAPHNAFTDLVRWHNRFYCAFREGEGHAGNIGRLRVLVSDDGEHWRSATLLSDSAYDLRDADISVTPDDRLMVFGGAQKVVNGGRATGSFASFSPDGEHFTKPRIVIPLGRWLWRVTWHKGKAYGITYATPEGRPFSSLVTSDDGLHWRTHVAELLGKGGWPTEAVIQFAPDDTAYILHRRDGKENTAYFGRAKPPYTRWKWYDLGIRLGGPNFIRLPDGEWLAAGRIYPGGARTELLWLDVNEPKMVPLLRLPSGGDTSYPGLVWHNGALWMSYYSSHEGHTSIYMAKIRIHRGKE